MTDYTPIDCGLHSEYELAIMHGRRLQLRWRDEAGKAHNELLRPLDLQACNKEEFLVVENSQGERMRLRLDHIERTEES